MADRTDESIDGQHDLGETTEPATDPGHVVDSGSSLVPDDAPIVSPPVDVDDRHDGTALDTPDVIPLPAQNESVDRTDEPVGDVLADSESVHWWESVPPDEHTGSDDDVERAPPPPVSEPSEFEGWSGGPEDPVGEPGDTQAEGETVLTPPISGDASATGDAGAAERSPESAPGGDAATGPAAAGGLLTGLLGRFRRGSEPEGEPAGTTGEPAPDRGAGSPSIQDRIGNALRSYFDPREHLFSAVPYRRLIGGAAVLVLLSLLANSGGAALIVLSALVPVLALITLTQHDVFEKESNLVIAGVAAAGAVAGGLLSGLASWIQGEQWFSTGKLNFAAGGFSGRFGEAAGNAPVVVWLLCGMLFPLIGLAAIGGLPLALQRFPQFRNEAMDAVIVGGAAAAGYSIGMSLVYWWPMVGDPGPATNVQDWTLRILGVAFVRTALLTFSGSLVGFGLWRYLNRQSPLDVGFPMAAGVLGFLFLHFGSIAVQPSGSWTELVATLVILVVVFAVYRSSLNQAIAIDRQALGDEGNRIVCPECHKVSPVGAFCAHCGHRFDQGASAATPS